MKIGYFLSCEEYTPAQLVEQAVLAERAGFDALWISDHFHPWNDEQGQSPFVWSVIGALSQVCGLPVTTAVTCPTVRTHPAVIAQAAATSAVLLDGRFTLGVGSGEALNEHVLGGPWPTADVRLEMLEEAVEVIRLLWQGGEQTHRGTHYTADPARVYDLPGDPIEIYVAASQPVAAELAGKIGDGLISTSPDEDVVEKFGQKSKPKLGMMHVAYDTDKEAALKRAHELWPNTALQGSLGQELATPSDFESAAPMVSPADVAKTTPHGPDPEPYLEQIRKYEDAGFTHVYINQIGDNKEEFCSWAAANLIR